MAKRLGVSRSAVANFEKNEDRLTLTTLKKLAAAMDCEFKYSIRPKQGRFSDRVWAQLSEGIAPPLPAEAGVESIARWFGGTDLDFKKI